jgi:Zn-dependent protease with chaperone function
MTGQLATVPGSFAAAWAIAWGTNRVAMRKWRQAAAAHWAERARLLWPARRGAGVNVLLLPICFGALQFALEGRFSAWCVAAAVAGWAGVLAGNYSMNRQILPGLTFRQWLRLEAMSWAMRMMFFLVWGGGAYLMPETINGWTLVIAASVLVFHVGLNWRICRWVSTRTGILVRGDERLKGIVAGTSERMGIRAPETWLLKVPLANAAALPLTRELVFTSGLMEVCSDEEAAGVCAHELAHLKEPKAVLTLRVIGSLWLFPLLFLKPALCAYGLAGFGLLGVSLALAWVTRKPRRRMEKRADKAAIELQNAKGVYSRALENIYRRNQIPAVSMSRRATHPHLYDRLLAAGIQPDFERPKPPGDIAWIYITVWMGFGVLIGWILAL